MYIKFQYYILTDAAVASELGAGKEGGKVEVTDQTTADGAFFPIFSDWAVNTIAINALLTSWT